MCVSCLGEQGEGGHWSPEAGISANAVDAGEGLAAIWGPWVFTMARRVCVGHVEEGTSLDHACGDSGCKFLDLATDVLEEGVTGPPPYQHDCVRGNII